MKINSFHNAFKFVFILLSCSMVGAYGAVLILDFHQDILGASLLIIGLIGGFINIRLESKRRDKIMNPEKYLTPK